MEGWSGIRQTSSPFQPLLNFPVHPCLRDLPSAQAEHLFTQPLQPHAASRGFFAMSPDSTVTLFVWIIISGLLLIFLAVIGLDVRQKWCNSESEHPNTFWGIIAYLGKATWRKICYPGRKINKLCRRRRGPSEDIEKGKVTCPAPLRRSQIQRNTTSTATNATAVTTTVAAGGSDASEAENLVASSPVIVTRPPLALLGSASGPRPGTVIPNPFAEGSSCRANGPYKSTGAGVEEATASSSNSPSLPKITFDAMDIRPASLVVERGDSSKRTGEL